jgi:hypothetical protein
VNALYSPHVVPLSLVALILAQLDTTWARKSPILETKARSIDPGTSKTLQALQTYAGPWLDSVPKSSVHYPEDEWLLLHYVFRCFSAGSLKPLSHIKNRNGLRCSRDGGAVESLDGKRFVFAESRTWLGMRTCTILGSREHEQRQFPLTTAICLSDWDFSCVMGQDEWQRFGIRPCLEGSGVSMFQLLICFGTRDWGRRWNECLDNIDSILRVSVSLINSFLLQCPY